MPARASRPRGFDTGSAVAVVDNAHSAAAVEHKSILLFLCRTYILGDKICYMDFVLYETLDVTKLMLPALFETPATKWCNDYLNRIRAIVRNSTDQTDRQTDRHIDSQPVRLRRATVTPPLLMSNPLAFSAAPNCQVHEIAPIY